MRLRTDETRRELIEAYAPIMGAVLRRALGTKHVVLLEACDRLLHDELVSAANLALVTAADTYDPSRGISFNTFLGWRVRIEAMDALRDSTGLTGAGRDTLRGASVVSLHSLLSSDVPGDGGNRDMRIAREALTRHDAPRDEPETPETIALREMMASMPVEKLRIVCAYFFDGLSMREMSRRMGIPRGRIAEVLDDVAPHKGSGGRRHYKGRKK